MYILILMNLFLITKLKIYIILFSVCKLLHEVIFYNHYAHNLKSLEKNIRSHQVNKILSADNVDNS